MANTNWTGNVDGDLNNASNWDNGVPASEDYAFFDSVNYTGASANPSSGTCVGMTYVSANTVISGGTFTGTVTNNGVINGGTFNGTVTNGHYINDGIFNGTVQNGYDWENHGYITGGTFNGIVLHAPSGATTVAHTSGGTFNGMYYGVGGEMGGLGITGGTFYGGVDATWNVYQCAGGQIGGGTFYCDVDGDSACSIEVGSAVFHGYVHGFYSIWGGTFYGDVLINQDEYGDYGIRGGTFYGSTTVPSGLYDHTVSAIEAGTFSGELKYVESSGYITGGNFSGITKITFRNSPTFTKEKGINGSGILGII